MPFWSDNRRIYNRRTTSYRRRLQSQQATNSAVRRWFFCALVMLAVTGLNFLPFQWAQSCKTYLAYCFQPGAAVGTKWAAWADWQADDSMLVAVWQRIIGNPEEEGLVYPCTGQIVSAYAWRHHPVTGQVEMHYGIDIQGIEGTPIQAAAAGVVREVAEEQNLGLYVVIDHGEGLVTRYAHLAEALVEAGAEVAKGQEIGKMGSSGLTNDTHLHFEVIVDGQPIDPLSVLPR
ncbi:MAG: M23 family metallopeptidase [Firmicutes bacterium]|nr:M23 family metallopeptidase [Bacillota bacterium]